MPFPMFFMSHTDLQSLLHPLLDKMEGELMWAVVILGCPDS